MPVRYSTGMGTAALVSLDGDLATIYDPDREYIDGEILERNTGGARSQRITGSLDCMAVKPHTNEAAISLHRDSIARRSRYAD